MRLDVETAWRRELRLHPSQLWDRLCQHYGGIAYQWQQFEGTDLVQSLDHLPVNWWRLILLRYMEEDNGLVQVRAFVRRIAFIADHQFHWDKEASWMAPGAEGWAQGLDLDCQDQLNEPVRILEAEAYASYMMDCPSSELKPLQLAYRPELDSAYEQLRDWTRAWFDTTGQDRALVQLEAAIQEMESRA